MKLGLITNKRCIDFGGFGWIRMSYEVVKGLYCPKCRYVGLICELTECPICLTSLELIDIDKELLKMKK